MFDFFSLPRELRDQIYENSELLTLTDYFRDLLDREMPTYDILDIVVFSSRLNSSLLRSNRPFATEYTERTAPNCRCVVGLGWKPLGEDRLSELLSKIPKFANAIPALELWLPFWHVDVMYQDQTWLLDSRFEKLRSIELKFVVHPGCGWEYVEMLLEKMPCVLANDKVKQVEVVRGKGFRPHAKCSSEMWREITVLAHWRRGEEGFTVLR